METFKQIWTALDKDDKAELAKSAFSSVNYLSQVAHGHKTASSRFALFLADRLTAKTGHQITADSLFPNDDRRDVA